VNNDLTLAHAIAAADPAALFGRRPRLLVVDDQPANVQVLYKVFAADHQVFMATTGEQALSVIAQQRPDLVLLDVMMPGMDGHAVCLQMKAAPEMRDIPVIFVTAQNDAAAEARGLEQGAVDFISKPIAPQIVRARVRTHLLLKAQGDLLRQWVYMDGLTNVGNRRRFDEALASEWGRAVRQREPLSVVMIDVDHFKRFNDDYGHQAGDDCLRRVAGALKSSLRRPTDLLARYGGEEFACLLPDTDVHGASALAEMLGQRVRELGIEHRLGVDGVVSVSLGVATKPAELTVSAAALLREADVQLYRAKSQGRSQACAGVVKTD